MLILNFILKKLFDSSLFNLSHLYKWNRWMEFVLKWIWPTLSVYSIVPQLDLHQHSYQIVLAIIVNKSRRCPNLFELIQSIFVMMNLVIFMNVFRICHVIYTYPIVNTYEEAFRSPSLFQTHCHLLLKKV